MVIPPDFALTPELYTIQAENEMLLEMGQMSVGTPDIPELTRLAIKAAKEGNKEGARVMFRQIVEKDRYNEQAMIWLARIAKNNQEREQWLRRVIEINPDNTSAQKALEKIAEDREEGYDRMVIIYGFAVILMLILLVVALVLVVR
jgi:CRISPR/Cas system-associated protein endoribonuclease Cas2